MVSDGEFIKSSAITILKILPKKTNRSKIYEDVNLFFWRRRFMRIIKAKDYNDMSRKAANIIAAQVQLKPDCVLGLATGSTPLGTYKELVAAYENGDLDFSKVTSVNLDEYKGITRENDQSYYYFMNDN